VKTDFKMHSESLTLKMMIVTTVGFTVSTWHVYSDLLRYVRSFYKQKWMLTEEEESTELHYKQLFKRT
jgi:hypothetical protein